MAERRMMAKSVIETDAFMDMPMSTQCLYFHLLLRGDDDGFIANPKRIMREVGSNEDDMKLLIAKRYIIPFESGVVVIRHWKIHNFIRSDRYKPTVCEERKLVTLKQGNVYEALPDGIPAGIPVGIPSDNQMSPSWDTQDRLGKDRLGKDRIDTTMSGKPDAETRYSDLAREVIAYLNQKTGAAYRATTKSTVEHIKARAKEGATLDDFKRVIDTKCAEWLGDERMTRYLRPDTLFGGKFDWYLNQPELDKKGVEHGSTRTTNRQPRVAGKARQHYDPAAEEAKWANETSGWD